MVMSRGMRWAGHVAHMGDRSNGPTYKTVVGTPEEKKRREIPVGPPGWNDNSIKMNLNEVQWEGVDLIHLVRNTDRWRALVNTVMDLRVP
jgi:hypothetical protein